jgi:hypothetical protein
MTLTSEGSTQDTQAVPAAHAVDLRKTYGAGQAPRSTGTGTPTW